MRAVPHYLVDQLGFVLEQAILGGRVEAEFDRGDGAVEVDVAGLPYLAEAAWAEEFFQQPFAAQAVGLSQVWKRGMRCGSIGVMDSGDSSKKLGTALPLGSSGRRSD